jgi:2-polyprenyl-3-methyl-5-hydroxy-6-metoxy-1,4-benzoquinol methylase
MDYYKSLPLRTRLNISLRWAICPFDLVEKHVPKKGTVLDIGCGFGIFSHYLAVQSNQRKVIGIDLVKKRIEQANKLVSQEQNLSFESANILDHRLPEADVITMIDVLHHIPSTELQSKLLKDCFISLKKYGQIIIKDVNKSPRWKYWWNYIHDYIMTKGEPVLYQDEKNVIKLLEKTGFILERTEIIGGYPYAHVIYIATKGENPTDTSEIIKEKKRIFVYMPTGFHPVVI